jgi:uncharacterized protein (DUF433 family)
MDWRDRMIIDPNVLVGKPVIKGTRISVELVIDLLGRGYSQEQILQQYDHVAAEDIQACLAYASELLTVEKVYSLVSQTNAMDAQDYPVRHFARMAQFATELKSLPAQVLGHGYSYESFGSWWVTFRFGGIPFRLTLDGKERRLVVERSTSRKPPYAWENDVWERSTPDLAFNPRDVIEVVRTSVATG